MPKPRGINGTDWIKIDRATYDACLDFIADFANWDNSTALEFLATSRALTKAAHEALGGAPGTRPLVVDPFARGGSIPLEALRYMPNHRLHNSGHKYSQTTTCSFCRRI